jgi:hypothetical protein
LRRDCRKINGLCPCLYGHCVVEPIDGGCFNAGLITKGASPASYLQAATRWFKKAGLHRAYPVSCNDTMRAAWGTAGAGGDVRHRVSAALLVAVAVVAALGWTGQCWAQAKLARIGFLTPASGGLRKAFVEALRALGYVEGQTITFEVRAAGNNPDRLPALAADLVRSKVDIIVAVSHLRSGQPNRQPARSPSLCTLGRRRPD